MVDIVINNTRYSIPITWDELSLYKAMQLETVTDALSDSLREYFAVIFEPSAARGELSQAQIGQLEQFYARALAIVGDVPVEMCLKTEPGQVASFVERYIAHFIVSMIFEPIFDPQHIDSFEWRGERLMVPVRKMDFGAEMWPLSGLSAEEFCRTSDLYVAAKVRYAAMIVAILCRPKGEKYDRQRAIDRARTMEQLPMRVVLEVFFCLCRLTIS